MKNIHLIPTDKPSRLYKDDNQVLTLNTHPVLKGIFTNGIGSNQHIYITSEEAPKHLDWYFCFENKKVKKCETGYYNKGSKKIILTTGQDLIEDGVQAIDDEFLEWLVKNPSCEQVEVKEKQHFESDKSKRINPLNGVYYSYKIIIPQEKPKQETLEEAANKYITNIGYKSDKQYYKFEKLIQFGAKWQAERMYSEEEVIAFVKWMYDYKADVNKVEELFEQFKKK